MISKSPYQAVIFDLDGTLVDSAPSILSSFESVLKRVGIQPLISLNNLLIGPPLRQTLTNLTGISDLNELNTLVEYFKESYDSEGYKATRVYDGVQELLVALSDIQVPMAIATNKRIVPTLKIITLLGWETYFKLIGALDSKTPPYTSKATLINSLLDEMSVDAGASLYVGDKWEDGEAAKINRMPFLAVGWGYGEWEQADASKGCTVVASPSDIYLLNKIYLK